MPTFDPTPHRPTTVTHVVESRFGLDGGAMFGIIPRPLWAKTNPPDAQNRIDMVSRCLYIEYPASPHPDLHPDRPTRVLVDVGMGTNWDAKSTSIYNIHDQDPGLARHLAASRIEAGDIDHVILTHLHFDHVGGLRRQDEQGAWRASFPNATHWVQQRNWSWAHGPSARDAGSYRQDDFAFLAHDDAPALELVAGTKEILPGIEVYPHNGHTWGMQVVRVTDHTGQVYAFAADLIPTSSHLRDPYVMGYDLNPVTTVEEKRTLLHEAARHDWIVVYQHDPVVAASRVRFDGRGRPVAEPVEG